MDLSGIYRKCRALGNTTKDKTGFFSMFTIDEWYTIRYNCGNFKVVIHEWCNDLAFDDYLDSIEIIYKGQSVCKANVHRDSAGDWRFKYMIEDDWVIELEKVMNKIKI